MRVVIADDETLLRNGLELLLRNAGFDVVGAAADADELLQLTDEHRPQVVVTDIHMPPDRQNAGLVAAQKIRVEYPGTGVLVVSQHVQRSDAMQLLGDSLTGVGYLLKHRIACVGDFYDSVRRVGEGGTALDPEVIAAMLDKTTRTSTSRSLTARQREVLVLVAQGRSNAAIAARLHVSEKAIVQHISRIYDSLGLHLHDEDHRRVLAVLRYLAA